MEKFGLGGDDSSEFLAIVLFEEKGFWSSAHLQQIKFS